MHVPSPIQTLCKQIKDYFVSHNKRSQRHNCDTVSCLLIFPSWSYSRLKTGQDKGVGLSYQGDYISPLIGRLFYPFIIIIVF